MGILKTAIASVSKTIEELFKSQCKHEDRGPFRDKSTNIDYIVCINCGREERASMQYPDRHYYKMKGTYTNELQTKLDTISKARKL